MEVMRRTSYRHDLHRHVHSIESVRGPFPRAREWRSLLLLASYGNGDMFIAGELVVRRVEAAPARAREIDLCPGMRSAMLTFVYLDVAGDEPRLTASIINTAKSRQEPLSRLSVSQGTWTPASSR